MAGVDIKYKGSTIATIQGTGSKTLNTQGKYCEGDILVDYVKEGITPSGTKNITSNGTVDITNYESASVNVSPNVTAKSITENGTYNASSDNVDGYSSVTVAVPVLSKQWVISLSEDTANNAQLTIAVNDDWLVSHKNDASLTISMVPLSAVTVAARKLVMCVHSNHNLWDTGHFGRTLRGANSSASAAGYNCSAAIKDTLPGGSGGNGFYFNDNTLMFSARDGGTTFSVPAGDWLITASVKE